MEIYTLYTKKKNEKKIYNTSAWKWKINKYWLKWCTKSFARLARRRSDLKRKTEMAPVRSTLVETWRGVGLSVTAKSGEGVKGEISTGPSPSGWGEEGTSGVSSARRDWGEAAVALKELEGCRRRRKWREEEWRWRRWRLGCGSGRERWGTRWFDWSMVKWRRQIVRAFRC